VLAPAELQAAAAEIAIVLRSRSLIVGEIGIEHIQA
jgi:hypothetical protein